MLLKSSVICDLLNMVGIFNTQPSTSFPTKQKLPFPETGQPTQSPYLDFVSDEFSFRGGFELAFPARDWESYLPFMEKSENTRLYPAIVERFVTFTFILISSFYIYCLLIFINIYWLGYLAAYEEQEHPK